MSMRALVRDEHGVALRRVPVPSLTRADDVIVEIAVAGVCRTDLAVADGKLGRSPIVLGHECAGVVVEGAFARGARVTIIPITAEGWLGVDRAGGFAERVAVPAACVREIRDLPLEIGAYVEPVAAAMGVLACVAPGARVLVGGAGRIADLTARVVRAAGAIVVDDAADVAVETDGDLAALVPRVRVGGVIVAKSRGVRAVAFDLGALVARELVIRGVGHGSFETAIEWLANGQLSVDDLLAPPAPLDEYERVLAAARASEAQKLMFAPGAC